jgi:hypothetical protein
MLLILITEYLEGTIARVRGVLAWYSASEEWAPLVVGIANRITSKDE